jgi:hypothetical protein
MNKEELRTELKDRGIRERSYSLEGGSPDERYVLERSRGGWSVFYSERGNRNDERWFATEDEACAEILRQILADPTTRVHKGPFGIPPRS